jgi:hypothetical protein
MVLKKIKYYFSRRKVVFRVLKNWLSSYLQEPWRSKGTTQEPVIVCVRLNARTRMFNYGWTLRHKHKIRTILVTQVFEYGFQKQAFDEIKIFFSYTHLEKIIVEIAKKYQVLAIIGSLQPAAQTLHLLNMKRSWPVFIDHYDSYWSLFHFSKLSIEGPEPTGNFSMEEIEAEKYCYTNADGVLARSGSLVKLFQEKNINTPIRLFEDRCNKKFFQPIWLGSGPKGKEWSVVYPGIFYPMHFDKRLFGDIQFVPLGKLFAKEKIHFHLYPSPHHNYLYSEYEAEAARNPYFHIHPTVDFDNIHQEISKYDFGWQAHDFSKAAFFSETSKQFELSIKFYSFLEAGLPIIVNELLERGKKIIKDTGAGLCIGNNAPQGLREIIENSDVATIRKNVEHARQVLEIDQISDELFGFLNNPHSSNNI